MATRREMLQALVASLGAGAVVPGLAAQDHFGRHLASPGAIEQADARAKAAAYKPEFLDQHQFATVASLAERIVPGASRAKTTEFIDQLLAADSRDNQRAFLTALGSFEGQALARGRPWIHLAEADQIAILTSASTMASSRPEAKPWTKGEPMRYGREPVTPAPLTLRDHFDLLKSWIAGAYYSSEIGMKELGWTGNVVFPAFPGCDHPGGHA